MGEVLRPSADRLDCRDEGEEEVGCSKPETWGRGQGMGDRGQGWGGVLASVAHLLKLEGCRD